MVIPMHHITLTYACAAGNVRAAARFLGFEGIIAPPPERFRTNDIRADEARNHKARYSPTEGS